MKIFFLHIKFNTLKDKLHIFIIMGKIAIFISVIALFVDCWGESHWNAVYLYNNSNDTIRCYSADGYMDGSYTVYPDTTLPLGLSNNSSFDEFYMGDLLSFCNPHEKGECFSSNYGNNIEKSLDKIKSDTLSIFLINNDTIKTYGYKYIAEHYKIICRYDLSRKDLRSLNYIVPYPPNRTMEHMHMFPSYQEIINKTSGHEE